MSPRIATAHEGEDGPALRLIGRVLAQGEGLLLHDPVADLALGLEIASRMTWDFSSPVSFVRRSMA